jgi:hypothetical protein
VKNNVFTAIVVIVLSIFAYFETLSYPYESAYFPRFIIIMLAVLGCMILANEFRKWPKARHSEKSKNQTEVAGVSLMRQPKFRKVILIIVSSLIYLILISRLGFFSTTLVYLPAMMWLLDVRKIVTLAFSTAVVVFFIYLIFRVFLKVPFPEGIVF